MKIDSTDISCMQNMNKTNPTQVLMFISCKCPLPSTMMNEQCDGNGKKVLFLYKP